MNSARNSLTGKAFILVLVAFCAVTLLNLRAMAQDYTEEQYKAFQDIQAEQAAAKKAALAIKFLQVPANAKTTIAKNVIAEYQGAMASMQKAGNWTELLRLGEQFVSVVPDDNYTITLLADGYSRQKDYKGFAAFGEKVFAKSPTPALASALAKAYEELGNNAKYIQWAEKTVSLDPDRYDMLFELTRSYAIAQRWPEAIKYANQSLKAIASAKKPDTTTDAQWKDYLAATNAQSYGVLGSAAYNANNFAQAITNLEKSVSFNKRNESAYYFLGMCYWKMGKADMAMLNFAKAFVMRGGTSASAKGYLDQLYKAGAGRGTLNGEERIIARAKMDLGIQ